MSNTPNLNLTKPDIGSTNWGSSVNGNWDTLDSNLPKSNFSASTGPSTNNDSTQGYSVGSRWFDTTNLQTYICISATSGAAVWLTCGIPTATIQLFAGNTIPAGWLACDGSAVSRTTYASLFTAIGSAYGAGNGSSTFNVPDLRGRVPMGAGTGTGGGSSGSGAPSGGSALTTRSVGAWGGEETHLLTGAESGTSAHNHTITDSGHRHQYNDAMNGAGAGNVNGAGNQGTIGQLSWNATTGITINNATAANASNSHNNIQPFTVFNFIIKN